ARRTTSHAARSASDAPARATPTNVRRSPFGEASTSRAVDNLHRPNAADFARRHSLVDCQACAHAPSLRVELPCMTCAPAQGERVGPPIANRHLMYITSRLQQWSERGSPAYSDEPTP